MQNKTSQDQAIAQMESIRELLADLTPEKAATKFVENMPEEKVLEHVQSYHRHVIVASDSISSLRQELIFLLCQDKIEVEGFCFDSHFEDAAQEAIQNDPLSIEVRSGWQEIGSVLSASEFRILLCTGGPSVAIIGDLDSCNMPYNPRIIYQDWGTEWQELPLSDEYRDDLQYYCNQFYFGE